MGAEIVKVEDPTLGDYARVMPPMLGPVSAMFHVVNRGKRSIVIDLKKPEGRELLLRMVPDFDVVFEQFRPGVMDRLGLGYEALRAARSDVILCSLSGYGQQGEMAAAAGHDLNYQALSGLLWLGGNRGGPPPLPTIPTADLCGAMNAVTAIAGALLARARDGLGEHLDISMTDSAAALAAPFIAAWTVEGPEAWAPGEALLGGGIAQYGVYRTRDGRHLAVGALEPKFFARFAELAGQPEWLRGAPLPGSHQEALREDVARVVEEKTLAEWQELLLGSDCCVSAVLDPGEAMEQPLFSGRGRLGSSERGEHPSSWVEHPLGVTCAGDAPLAGEHTDEVLAELGLDAAAIAGLRDRGVVS